MISLCLCLGLATFAFSSSALVQNFGREPVHLIIGTNGLDAIINHPTRVSGTMGPFGLSSRFQYSGTSTNFAEVLNLYSKLPQSSRTLYLTAQPSDESTAPKQLRYELSLNFDGQSFLHLHVGPSTDLSFLKPSACVNLENLPEPAAPTDRDAQEKLAAAQAIIDRFLKPK